MWVAPEHAVSDPESLRRLVRDYPFATLHSAGPDGPLASHLPIIPDPTGRTDKPDQKCGWRRPVFAACNENDRSYGGSRSPLLHV